MLIQIIPPKITNPKLKSRDMPLSSLGDSVQDLGDECLVFKAELVRLLLNRREVMTVNADIEDSIFLAGGQGLRDPT